MNMGEWFVLDFCLWTAHSCKKDFQLSKIYEHLFHVSKTTIQKHAKL